MANRVMQAKVRKMRKARRVVPRRYDANISHAHSAGNKEVVAGYYDRAKGLGIDPNIIDWFIPKTKELSAERLAIVQSMVQARIRLDPRGVTLGVLKEYVQPSDKQHGITEFHRTSIEGGEHFKLDLYRSGDRCFFVETRISYRTKSIVVKRSLMYMGSKRAMRKYNDSNIDYVERIELPPDFPSPA